MYNAEDVIELLQYHDHELILTSFFKFEIKDPLQKAEEAEEPKPEPKSRTTTVTKLSEGLGPIEDGIKVFEDTDSEKQPAAKVRRGIMRTLVCCEVTLRGKEMSFSLLASRLDFFN